MTNDRNLQLASSLSIVKRRWRSTGRSPHSASGSATPPGSSFFTYTNSFSLAVFECTHEKIYYIKKKTIPHMANTNVCRYSQCIAPKTPTTQTAVKLPMSSAVFFCKQEVATATFTIKALWKTPVAPLCEWINARAKRLNWIAHNVRCVIYEYRKVICSHGIILIITNGNIRCYCRRICCLHNYSFVCIF